MVAMVDRNDPYHARCATALASLPPDDARHGHAAQEDLWGYVVEGIIRLHQPAADEWERVRTLMQTYRDAPMDLADASLVVAGERLRLKRVLTTDRHFHAYRLQGRDAFDVVFCAS